MATRSKGGNRARGARTGAHEETQAMRDSVQRIWLAGLGALERARTQGPRVFEALVEQGRSMGARAAGMADDALKTMRQASSSSTTWQKLEHEVQERLAKSLNRLGMADGKEVEALARQVRELNEYVRSMMGSAGETPTRGRRKPAAAGAARPHKTRTAKARARARKRRAPRAASS